MSRFLILVFVLLLIPLTVSLAETALDTELVINGGAESDAITGWTDDKEEHRWNSSVNIDGWASPAAGSKFFYLFFPAVAGNPDAPPMLGSMSQEIVLSGTEGSGLFSNISAGTISLHFSISMYQAITLNNQAKVTVEEYSADGTLLETSEVVNTTSAGVLSDQHAT